MMKTKQEMMLKAEDVELAAGSKDQQRAGG